MLTLALRTEKEIIRLLPDEVRKKHWVLSKHSPTLWQDLVAWYYTQEKADPRVLHMLETGEQVVYSRIQLERLIRVYETLDIPPDLSLPKTRRPSYS